MILSGQQLVDTLREKCENVQNRIWITSPYIGSLKDIYTIIGGKWMLPSIDCRILTDIDSGFIRQDTFNEFIKNQIEIKSLVSIHAKIYIIDNWCLIASANLTGTAFYCRYEIGVESNDIKNVENIFNNWWNIAIPVSQIKLKPSKSLLDYQDGHLFKKKFKSTPYTSGKQDKYEALCEKYIKFANLYEEITGRNSKMVNDGFTLLQEVDYFFNFLYHEHPQRPSHGFTTRRRLTSQSLKNEINKYFKSMSIFYNEDPQHWRLDRCRTVKKLLSPKQLQKLEWKDAKEVVLCLHCLSSYPINRTKFLNPNNNTIEEIKRCWDELLHHGQITATKITKVTNAIKYFGHSSIYELIGWYFPEKYPIMNKNSDCGMRFFGFEV